MKKQPRTVDAQLPQNRFEQLGNILRHHFPEVVLSSMYTLIFAVPAVFWIAFTTYFPFFQENNILNLLVVYGVLALFIMVMGLGFGGGFYFYKRLLFNEGAMLTSDFFIGVKKNARHFLQIFLFIGILYLLLHIGLGATAATEIDSNTKAVLMGLSYTLFFLLLFVTFFMQSQTTLFEGGFFSLFWQGLKFMLATLYKGIGIYALVLLPFLVYEFVPYFAAGIVVLVYISFFGFGFAELLLMQFSNHVFDLSVNRRQYPEIYRKGLAKSEEEKSFSEKDH